MAMDTKNEAARWSPLPCWECNYPRDVLVLNYVSTRPDVLLDTSLFGFDLRVLPRSCRQVLSLWCRHFQRFTNVCL